MADKKKERAALNAIRQIVGNLGEDSYVAIALDGCLDIAEENIDSDFACSMRQRWESSERALAKVQKDFDLYKSAAEKEIEDLREANHKIERALSWVPLLSYQDIKKIQLALNRDYLNADEKIREAEKLVLACARGGRIRTDELDGYSECLRFWDTQKDNANILLHQTQKVLEKMEEFQKEAPRRRAPGKEFQEEEAASGEG